MPSTGGICRKLWAETAIAMVTINSPTTNQAPCRSSATSVTASGCSLGTENDMMTAGISQLTSDGRNNTKNPWKGMMPFCHTINVVMSPNGEKAPPALAATTILIQATITKAVFFPPTAMATVAISRAVVRLSAMGDITNARAPVIQKIVRNENPCETSHTRSTSNTPRSSIVLINVIAARRNRNSSANSSRLWRTACPAVWVSPIDM